MIRTIAETGSTNADLLALTRAGADEGSWLRAGRQTAGRGRQGRAWASPAGNLYASTLVRLRPTDPPPATLALVAGVAVAECLSAFHPGEGRGPASAGPQLDPGLRRGGVEIKWPNDLLLDGAKLAGVLLERAEDAVVVGVGANLAHHPDLPDRPTTSLAAHGAAVAPEAAAEVLAESFARWLARWRGEGLAPVRSRWLARAHPVGTALTVRTATEAPLDGLFDGLAEDGALLLRLASGERRVIHAGDVFLL